ncbi:GGDEF domain-containing protein [Halopseudomonas salegens]|uniref:diguanylate cyclase n=1 Tax=Halopseudomonas salegens TaxID=1434072 RepID=A0A1H2DY98_9GAMM|nr:diguanylate cyclase [Halopseudomonas salegens]SDT87853.1 diguanylate cyclase (GGDEF) domain-containing protein [Halopseudomonas salegens]
MADILSNPHQHQRKVLRALLWLTVFVAGWLGLVNLQRGLFWLGVLDLVYAGFSMALLLIVNRTPRLRLWSLVYLLPFLTITVYSLTLPDTSHTGFAYIQAIPIVSYLLLGVRPGFWLSLLFVSLGVLAYSYRFLLGGELIISVVSLLNIIISSFAIMLFSHIYERSRVQNENHLRELAATDTLTGLSNRMSLSGTFQRECSRALRLQAPLSLVVIDIDHFKYINDRHGHAGGDLALCHLADNLRERLRDSDLICRLGGEEFALLLPDTNLEQAARLTDKLRQWLAERPVPLPGEEYVLTFSAGVATLGEDAADLDSLLLVADRRMYEAKAGGRNQVVAAGQHYRLSAEPPAGRS